MRSSRVAALSIVSNTSLVVLKIIIGALTGSVAIVSEAIHSGLDLVASVIAYISVRTSHQPPDRSHPFGHGKIENVSGTIETLLIFIAGAWIIYESASKLLSPTTLRLPYLGIAVMLFGALVNFLVGRKIGRVGEETKSVAMKSNALHLMTDVYTSLGVAASLVLVSVTGMHVLDPLIAIGIALFIMKEALDLGKESFLPLVDVSLTDKEHRQIISILKRYAHEYIEFHDLRTRRSGPEEHIDLHLVVAADKTVAEAHSLCDRVEADIRSSFPQAQILIHIEPESERGQAELPLP